MSITTSIVILCFLLLLDILLVRLSKIGKLSFKYHSAVIYALKHSIRFGDPWNLRRLTHIFDTFYFNTSILLGFWFLKSYELNVEYVLIPILVFILVIILIVQKLKNQLLVVLLPALIDSAQIAFIVVGFFGCSLWLHHNYGVQTEIAFLYLLVIPITNMIYRKVNELGGRSRMSKRQKVLNAVKQESSLSDGSAHVYRLVHTHDERERMDTAVYLLSRIPVDRMNLLIAYIQFKSSEIEETYGMSQEDVGGVLSNLYDCRLIRPFYEELDGRTRISGFDIDESEVMEASLYEIDLYMNWEQWCGVSDQIVEVKLFHHDDLEMELRAIINEYYR